MVDLYMCSYNSRVDDYIKCVLSVWTLAPYCLPEEVIIKWSVPQCALCLSTEPLSPLHLRHSQTLSPVFYSVWSLSFQTMRELCLLCIRGAVAEPDKSAPCLCSDIFLNINKLSCHLWLEEEADLLLDTGWVPFIPNTLHREFIIIVALQEEKTKTFGCGYSWQIISHWAHIHPSAHDLSLRAQKCSITARPAAFQPLSPGRTASPRSALLRRVPAAPEATHIGICAREHQTLSRHTSPSPEQSGTASGAPCLLVVVVVGLDGGAPCPRTPASGGPRGKLRVARSARRPLLLWRNKLWVWRCTITSPARSVSTDGAGQGGGGGGNLHEKSFKR